MTADSPILYNEYAYTDPDSVNTTNGSSFMFPSTKDKPWILFDFRKVGFLSEKEGVIEISFPGKTSFLGYNSDIGNHNIHIFDESYKKIKDSFYKSVSETIEKQSSISEKNLRKKTSKHITDYIGGAWSQKQKEKFADIFLEGVKNKDVDRSASSIADIALSEKRQFTDELTRWKVEQGGRSSEKEFFRRRASDAVSTLLGNFAKGSKVLETLMDIDDISSVVFNTKDLANELFPIMMKGLINGDVQPKSVEKMHSRMCEGT